jgi:alkanesulfonate monooxygenase
MKPCEVSWFSALCDEDSEFLGVTDPLLQAGWEHSRDLVLQAETGGFDNILLPSGYIAGIDTLAFGAAIASHIRRIRLLMAVRMGETWPPALARQLATIDRILGVTASGLPRLTINIISSDRPGERMESEPRYQRTIEEMHILRTLLNGERLEFKGEFYDLNLPPPGARTTTGKCPPFYFGGLSPAAREAAAQGCDVYLMWPDTIENVREIVADLTRRASNYGRSLRFGYRVHVVVRETEAEARQAAERLLSRLDPEVGDTIVKRALDSGSAGVARQTQMREEAAHQDGYIERNLWTGIGRARSGAGAAIVGDPDQVLAKIAEYRAAGIEAFIFSGYPHAAAGDLFARHVLPHIDHAPLAVG